MATARLPVLVRCTLASGDGKLHRRGKPAISVFERGENSFLRKCSPVKTLFEWVAASPDV
jgi:hypothetical protein